MGNDDSAIPFGFLRENWAIEFEFGKIEPVAEFEKVRKAVIRRTNADGFLYPPLIQRVEMDPDGTNRRTIPKTKRPGLLHPVPASHILTVQPAQPEPSIRDGSAGFILHLTAFLFRTRLQFADWWFDGRIPITKGRGFGMIIFNPTQAANYLTHCHRLWLSWPEVTRRRFINILYMFSRAPSYEWDWEEFSIEYMILDALWKTGEELFALKCKGHADRIRALCAHFSVQIDPGWLDVKRMVQLRNDLFHESLWFGARPGSTIGELGYHMPTRMWVLNETLIGRFLDLP